jgi:hypothetical protein
MPAPTDAVLSAAHSYIDCGWPVFLLGRSKRPVANCQPCRTADTGHDAAACDCLTCHGFYAATFDPTRLAAMRDAIPDGLLAIRTGRVSGLLVVDVDPRNRGAIDRDVMSPTATVATGGGGWHLYYRHPGTPTVAKLPDRTGVDVKGDGGYVAAPPSIHPDTKRRYRWIGGRPVGEMPPALRAAVIAPPPPAPPDIGAVPTRAAGGISSPTAVLAAHLRAVENAPEGKRRTTLYGAARGVARMVAAGAITHTDAIAVLTDAGRRAEQTARDIRAAITGGFRDEGVTP